MARINDLFARIGETKVSYLTEQQLRALGGSCVKPLNKFVQASDNPGKRQKRERAALIVSEVAQPRHIPALIELLGDSSPRVREYAELGLERLTGRSGPPLPRLVTAIPLDPVQERSIRESPMAVALSPVGCVGGVVSGEIWARAETSASVRSRL